MLDKYIVVVVVVLVCILLVIYTQRAEFKATPTSLKERLQKQYTQYKVIERHHHLLICEIGLHDQLEELIVIRIDPNQTKNMRSFGRTVTFTYAKSPSLREMRKDFAPYLSRSSG